MQKREFCVSQHVEVLSLCRLSTHTHTRPLVGSFLCTAGSLPGDTTLLVYACSPQCLILNIFRSVEGHLGSSQFLVNPVLDKLPHLADCSRESHLPAGMRILQFCPDALDSQCWLDSRFWQKGQLAFCASSPQNRWTLQAFTETWYNEADESIFEAMQVSCLATIDHCLLSACRNLGYVYRRVWQSWSHKHMQVQLLKVYWLLGWSAFADGCMEGTHWKTK